MSQNTSLSTALMLEKGGVAGLVGAGGKTTLMYGLARELAASGASVLTTTTTKIFKPGPDQAPHFILTPSGAGIIEAVAQLGPRNRHLCAASAETATPGKIKGFKPGFIDALAGSGRFHWIIVEADGAAGRSIKAPAPHEPVIPSSTGWVIAVIGLDGLDRPLDEASVFRADLFARITGLSPGDPVSPRAVAALIRHEQGLFKGAPNQAKRILFLNKADGPWEWEQGRQLVKALEETGGGRLDRIVVGRAAHAAPVREWLEGKGRGFKEPRGQGFEGC